MLWGRRRHGGVKLGWSSPERAAEQRQAARKGAAAIKVLAVAHAENVFPVIEQIRTGGASLSASAARPSATVSALPSRRIVRPTASGKMGSVRRACTGLPKTTVLGNA
jgi:hypothetical protein